MRTASKKAAAPEKAALPKKGPVSKKDAAPIQKKARGRKAAAEKVVAATKVAPIVSLLFPLHVAHSLTISFRKFLNPNPLRRPRLQSQPRPRSHLNPSKNFPSSTQPLLSASTSSFLEKAAEVSLDLVRRIMEARKLLMFLGPD